MGHRIAKWVADDGSEHDSEREMVLHELALIDAKEIDAFLRDEEGKLPKRYKEYTKLLTSWQQYVRTNSSLGDLHDGASSSKMNTHENDKAAKEWVPSSTVEASFSENDPFKNAVAL